MGDIDDPENFIVTIYLEDDFSFWGAPIAKVCLIEKIFQIGDLNLEYTRHVENLK
jgi:hypothetical protein